MTNYLNDPAYHGGVIIDWKGAIPANVQATIDGLHHDAQAMVPPKQCSIECF